MISKCVFDNHPTECDALCEKKCFGCTFRKTKEEYDKGRRKAYERIEKLPLSVRIAIHRKYFT